MQLNTMRAEAQGVEARLRSEIENLKGIINQLEMRLGESEMLAGFGYIV